MSDPKVREDEKSRPTTVEHIKQLRDRLEKTNETHKAGELTRKLVNIDQKIDAVMAVVQRGRAAGGGE